MSTIDFPIAAPLMPYVDKKSRNPRPRGQSQLPHAPMGEHRFQELMSQLGCAFALADDGPDKLALAQEKELQRQQWVAERDTAIKDIVALIDLYGLDLNDLD